MSTKLTVLWNDDVMIIDYLADMLDRDPIRILQAGVDKHGDQPLCLVRKSFLDDKFVVILWKSQLGYNMPENHLILFSHPTLTTIISYFCQVMGGIPYNEPVKRSIIQEILNTLQRHLQKIEQMETQTNY